MIFDGAWDGKPWKLLAVAVFSSAMLAACVSDDSSGKQEAPLIADGEYVPVRPESPPGWPAIQWPADNAFTPAKAILGRRLFAETRLSRDGTVSCMWCHDDARAYSDKHSIGLSRGVRQQFTLRNAPTLTNVAFGKRFFFEGDVSTLEEQALRPLYASGEMDMTGSEIEAMLAADSAYPRLFRQAFGDAPITMAHLTQALATYERTLISAHSPYDRWAGGDTGALSASAKRGAAVFFGKGGCAACHAPP
ncbi:MAG TPA: hypothetical protein DCQ83_06400, partial [Fibrobacteres bacterium]|nr:hypothetical protein [Fibrobacterota bacterium]